MFCLRQMALQVFTLIDGYSSSSVADVEDDTTAATDRRISFGEWVGSLAALGEAANSWAPFVALQDVDKDTFCEIDDEGTGMILLPQFCKWLERAEVLSGSELGIELSIGDDD